MHGLVMDSDLDASSQYPSPDGLATPETQLIAKTKGVEWGFLSYYHMLPYAMPHKEKGLGLGTYHAP